MTPACISISRFLGIAVGLTLGFAMTLATKLPQANAAENPVSTASHFASSGVISPIELGPSQKERCKRTAPNDKVPYENCVLAGHYLALMNGEPRDKVWADKMESDLSDWVQSLVSEGITSRNVECRLSWCIVEVGSTQGHLPEMGARDQQKRKLFETQFLYAPDVDDPNVGDMVIIFKRYCKSSKELLEPDGRVVPDFDTMGQKC
jgi:hypothetical protein